MSAVSGVFERRFHTGFPPISGPMMEETTLSSLACAQRLRVPSSRSLRERSARSRVSQTESRAAGLSALHVHSAQCRWAAHRS